MSNNRTCAQGCNGCDDCTDFERDALAAPADGAAPVPSMVISMDEGAKEPRVVSWNDLAPGTHALYAAPVTEHPASAELPPMPDHVLADLQSANEHMTMWAKGLANYVPRSAYDDAPGQRPATIADVKKAAAFLAPRLHKASFALQDYFAAIDQLRRASPATAAVPEPVGLKDEQVDEVMRACMRVDSSYAFVGDAAFPRGRETVRAALASLAGHPAVLALEKACDLLSMTIGTLMSARPKIGYVDNSVIAKLVAEAVEFLRPWPEKMPEAAPAVPADDNLLRDALKIAHDHIDMGALRVSHGNDAALIERGLAAAPAVPASGDAAPFQQRVQPWMLACFGEVIAADREERNHRFLEESLELVQACGCTASEAHQLVDYVYGRPVGEPSQEVGGVMVTLAALCLANGLDMHGAAEIELARIWTKVEAIRAKQAAKPKHSPLPAAQEAGTVPAAGDASNLVPGQMHCARCKFQLTRTVLYMGNGAVGSGDSKTEPCPNGCGPLWPVTWEQAAREAWATGEALFERAKKAEDALAAVSPPRLVSCAPEAVAPRRNCSHGCNGCEACTDYDAPLETGEGDAR